MSGRARLEVLALGLLFLISASATPAQAAESRSAATQDGWWNRLQGPQEGEPDGNPIRPVVPAIPVPPNGVVLSVDTAEAAGGQSPASPSSVQISWLNYDSGNIAVELAATPGVPAASADSGPAASETVAAAPSAAAAGAALDNPGASRAFPATGSGVSAGSGGSPSGPAGGEATTAAPEAA